MGARLDSRLAYERPRVVDYGTLRELTADVGMLVFGAAALSTPLTPGPPPPGPDTPGPPAGPSTVPTPGGELVPPGGGGEVAGEGPVGEGAPAGAESQGGGGGGGGGGPIAPTGAGGDGSLPFTGFAAAMAGAVGAGLMGAGAALRRAVRRMPPGD